MNKFSNDGSFMLQFNKKDDDEKTEETKEHKGTRLSASLSSQLRFFKSSTQKEKVKTNLAGNGGVFGAEKESDDFELDPKTREAMQKVIIAVSIDGCFAEERERNRNKSNPAYWFLQERSSPAFKYYRKQVKDVHFDDEQQEKCEIKMKLPEKRMKKLKFEESPIDRNSMEEPQNEDLQGFDEFKPLAVDQITIPAAASVPQRTRKRRWGIEGQGSNTWIGHVAPPTLVDPLVSFIKQESPVIKHEIDDIPSTSATQNNEDILDSEAKKKAREIGIKALARMVEKSVTGDFLNDPQDLHCTDGTWEHKLRAAEMSKTLDGAEHANLALGEGKHHLADFLPPEENQKLLDALSGKPVDSSEYQQNKLNEGNKGFQLLSKMGWQSGSGLGAAGQGIIAPINKGQASNDLRGIGASTLNPDADVFDVYRNKMMLAYKHRPNPLNNPRRAYY